MLDFVVHLGDMYLCNAQVVLVPVHFLPLYGPPTQWRGARLYLQVRKLRVTEDNINRLSSLYCIVPGGLIGFRAQSLSSTFT